MIYTHVYKCRYIRLIWTTHLLDVYDPGLGVVHGVPEVRESDHDDGYEPGAGQRSAVERARNQRRHRVVCSVGLG